MKTVDLKQTSTTLEELLHWASLDPVLILAQNGHEFLLEEADEFDREIAVLGGSEKFMGFLEERSQEEGTIPLEEIERELGLLRS